MAYEQGAATSKEDFVDKLTTFAAANGWTKDEFSAANDRATIHINNLYVSFRWDAVASGGITAFQSLDYNQELAGTVLVGGGTGYPNGSQTFGLTGGTYTVQATIDCTVSGGIIQSIDAINEEGNYTVVPGNPVTIAGGNNDATFTASWQGVPGGEHADDSGNGDDSGAIDSERRMSDVGNGPYENHWFFASAESGVNYLFAVLESSPGIFKSFGAGETVKFGTWTGGEWMGMTKTESSFDIRDSRHNFIFDGAINTNSEAATIHAEGLPGQGGSSKWGVCMFSNDPGTDKAANARVHWSGGAREGWLNHALQGMVANPNNGYVPMIPYLTWYRTSSSNWRYMGRLPHSRELNGTLLIAGEEFTIGGSETWKVFPYSRKADSGTPHSGNIFFAVRKIV